MNEQKILIVEDDPATVRLLQYTLNQEGYKVLSAPNGLRGVRMAQQEKPDLIILDVMLPGVDGFEICHRLRRDCQTARIPILMFSAKAQEIDRSTGLKVGADEYITKPADPSVVVNRVRVLLAQKAESTSTESRQ